MEWNKQQKEALTNIETQLIKGDVLAWTLMGYAGTGKTTLAGEIAGIAKKDKYRVVFIAPTNKAAEVLRRKGNKGAMTVHKLLYTVDRYGNFIKKAATKDDDDKRLLIICDEASMLSDKLLDDLEEFATKKESKILYMGDPFQLPPVGKYSRTVFDNEYKSVLTQVMRQGDGSAILDWATALRQKKTAFSPTSTHGDVSVESKPVLWNDYLAKLKAGKDITMVTWKNEARIRFNQGVRKALGFDGKILQAGEPIMGISNGAFLRNGETMKVPENIELLGKDKLFIRVPNREKALPIVAEFYRYKEDGEVHHLILVPSYNGASIAPQNLAGLRYWRDGYKRDFVDLCGRPMLSPTVTICTYGYAITAHKSQGSQWEEVYITGTSKLYNEQLTNARWLYTAVTRAESKVHILDGECAKLDWKDMAA